MFIKGAPGFNVLTHWDRDKMAAIFQATFENVWISIKISKKFVPKVPINNIPALVLIMAWCQPGNKPLSEPMMVSLPSHICVIRPQWVNIETGNIRQDAKSNFHGNQKHNALVTQEIIHTCIQKSVLQNFLVCNKNFLSRKSIMFDYLWIYSAWH